MVLFATPDFGASGVLVLFVLIAWAIVLAFVGIGVVCGSKIAAQGRRAMGFVCVGISLVVPLMCCFGPPHAIRLMYGNYPLGRYPNGVISEGMTPDDVIARLGTPHERTQRNDRESWYYWLDSFGIGYFGVNFGPDGRVTGTHGN